MVTTLQQTQQLQLEALAANWLAQNDHRIAAPPVPHQGRKTLQWRVPLLGDRAWRLRPAHIHREQAKSTPATPFVTLWQLTRKGSVATHSAVTDMFSHLHCCQCTCKQGPSTFRFIFVRAYALVGMHVDCCNSSVNHRCCGVLLFAVSPLRWRHRRIRRH